MGQASRAEALAAEDDRPTDGERSFVLIRFKCVANTTFDNVVKSCKINFPEKLIFPDQIKFKNPSFATPVERFASPRSSWST